MLWFFFFHTNKTMVDFQTTHFWPYKFYAFLTFTSNLSLEGQLSIFSGRFLSIWCQIIWYSTDAFAGATVTSSHSFMLNIKKKNTTYWTAAAWMSSTMPDKRLVTPTVQKLSFNNQWCPQAKVAVVGLRMTVWATAAGHAMTNQEDSQQWRYNACISSIHLKHLPL